MKVQKLSVCEDVVFTTIEDATYILKKSDLANAIESLKLWQYTGNNNFSIKLIELIAKADNENKGKLFRSYPEYVCAYLLWFYKELEGTKFNDDQEFFECMKLKFL